MYNIVEKRYNSQKVTTDITIRTATSLALLAVKEVNIS